MYGAVSGIEDHGYLIDIGMEGITAFLPTHHDDSLHVGVIRRFRITESNIVSILSGEARTVTVALHSASDKHEVKLRCQKMQFYYNATTYDNLSFLLAALM